MAERTASRPWTEQEDHLLRQAVAEYGENDNWKNIALRVAGRSNKACRKRWLHSLQPNVKKSAWTPSEDQLLLDLYQKHGSKWSLIARNITGRTDDACSKRYREALDPSLKKDEWTAEEDARLMQVYNRIGGKWCQVGQELQRSGLGCRNRWRLLERKKVAKANQSSSPTSAVAAHEIPPSPEESPPPASDYPYFPPEAYPSYFHHSNPLQDLAFQDPLPPPLEIPDPIIAPFHSSSSSLSAALSNPPPAPLPLPPISASNTPELVEQRQLDGERQPSLSPLSQNGMPEINDVYMSMNDPSQNLFNPQAVMGVAISQHPYEPDNFSIPPIPVGFESYFSASPISITPELSRVLEPFTSSDLWKSRSNTLPEFDFDSPRSAFGGFGFGDAQDDYSSANSTPFHAPFTLSPTSSPLPTSVVDLPTAEPTSDGSLLFSPADGNSASLIHRPKKTVSRKHRSLKVPVGPCRLSSTLRLSEDPNVKPYACGRPSCWPAGAVSSSSCFGTSGELIEHGKEKHADEPFSDKPYRCALVGCDKSWKSINGLQYHLQISSVHFTNAIHDKFSRQPSTPITQMANLNTEGVEEDEGTRQHRCPMPGCYNAYRQGSGLRYHLKHGHPPDQPEQLNFMPPALERQLPAKAKKLRAKPPPDIVSVSFTTS